MRNANQYEVTRAAPEPRLDAPPDISDGAGGIDAETAAEAEFHPRTTDDESEK